MHFSAKKLFLIGFFVLLLVGIPVSVWFLQQQQETRSRAEKATNLSFTPDSSIGAPITKNLNDTVTLNVSVDPGTNLVSFVKLEIQYDPDKLAPAETNAFQPNTAVFPSTLEGPVYTAGKIAVTLSVGPDPTKALQSKVTAATINFKAIGATGADTPTLVTYSANTQALSIGSTDEASENVLAGSTPATIIITGGAGPTATPEPTSPDEPTPTTDPGDPTPTTEPEPTTAGNSSPVCTALTADTTSGAAPLSVTLTANGTDSDGTISKATFNFGDGQVSDVTTGGGLGTDSVNVQLAHTYTTAGTYQATAILTDDGNGVSSTTNCAQTITVSGDTTDTTTPATATPTIAAAGSAEIMMGFGAIAAFLMVGGALIFFLL